MHPVLLLCLLIFTTLAVGYVFWLRPQLKARPSLGFLWKDEEAFGRALSVKFDGLKGKIVTAFVFAAGFIVEAFDWLAPYVGQANVDFTKISDKIPADLWPFIIMGLLALVGWFRKLGERSLLAEIQPAPPVAPVPPATPKV